MAGPLANLYSIDETNAWKIDISADSDIFEEERKSTGSLIVDDRLIGLVARLINESQKLVLEVESCRAAINISFANKDKVLSQIRKNLKLANSEVGALKRELGDVKRFIAKSIPQLGHSLNDSADQLFKIVMRNGHSAVRRAQEKMVDGLNEQVKSKNDLIRQLQQCKRKVETEQDRTDTVQRQLENERKKRQELTVNLERELGEATAEHKRIMASLRQHYEQLLIDRAEEQRQEQEQLAAEWQRQLLEQEQTLTEEVKGERAKTQNALDQVQALRMELDQAKTELQCRSPIDDSRPTAVSCAGDRCPAGHGSNGTASFEANDNEGDACTTDEQLQHATAENDDITINTYHHEFEEKALLQRWNVQHEQRVFKALLSATERKILQIKKKCH